MYNEVVCNKVMCISAHVSTFVRPSVQRFCQYLYYDQSYVVQCGTRHKRGCAVCSHRVIISEPKASDLYVFFFRCRHHPISVIDQLRQQVYKIQVHSYSRTVQETILQRKTIKPRRLREISFIVFPCFHAFHSFRRNYFTKNLDSQKIQFERLASKTETTSLRTK